MGNFLTDRKSQKYISDIFINPTKSLALLFSLPALVLTGCITFAIAEGVHCYAHIKGALQKERTPWWKLAKSSIFAARLIASLTGAISLFVFTLLGSAMLGTLLIPVFTFAFIAATICSTLHKLRGFLDHLKKPKTPGFLAHLQHVPHLFKKGKSTQEESMSKTYGLLGRALTGMTGSALSIVIVLKVALIMSLVTTPIGLAVGAVIFGGMMLQKAYKAYRYHAHLQKPLEKKPSCPSVRQISLHPRRQSLPNLSYKNAGQKRDTFFFHPQAGLLNTVKENKLSLSAPILK